MMIMSKVPTVSGGRGGDGARGRAGAGGGGGAHPELVHGALAQPHHLAPHLLLALLAARLHALRPLAPDPFNELYL